MKISNSLEPAVVSLRGLECMPAPEEDEKEAGRMFFVAATRAAWRLVIEVGGDGGFGMKFE